MLVGLVGELPLARWQPGSPAQPDPPQRNLPVRRCSNLMRQLNDHPLHHLGVAVDLVRVKDGTRQDRGERVRHDRLRLVCIVETRVVLGIQ